MNWRDLQAELLKGNPDRIWGTCPACGKQVIQAVGVQHIREEHPEIAENIDKVVEKARWTMTQKSMM